MSYVDTASLASDRDFQSRLAAAVQTEATGLTDPLSDLILSKAMLEGAGLFIGPVSCAPGLSDKYANGGQESITDGDILAAVQANWVRIGSLHSPTAP